jgi:hypothetical protein
MNAAMSSIRSGLTDFLDHISRQPFHPILVERYLSLAFELPAELRREAMDQLNHILVEPNPGLALRSNYHYMKHIRHEDSNDPDEEIFVLHWIQSCFRELGRHNQARLIGEEITRISERHHRLQESQAPGAGILEQHPHLVKEIRIDGLEEGTREKALGPYDKLGQEIFAELVKLLGSMQSMRHQRLAIEKLIQGLDALYQKSGPKISKAIQTYGQNPLIWTRDGEFRPAVAQYFQNCRVFHMGKDDLTPLRIRMTLEMLTAYYDQRALGHAELEKQRGTRLKLLSEMINIFLDAGVTFPAFVMGAS